jgi:hypothetical protein
MTLDALLAASDATEAFKRDVLAYADRQSAPAITLLNHAPRVKVLRLLTQLLADQPQMPISRVEIHGVSGCADFRGWIAVETEAERRVFDFVWDCHWRASQEGWTDCFGFPDQIRAAQEFGWQCFADWRPRAQVQVAAV